MNGAISAPGVALFLTLFGIVFAALLFSARRPVMYPATVEVRPGDVVLIHCDDPLSSVQCEALRAMWKHARETDGVLILHSGMRVTIVAGAREHGARAHVIGR